MFNTRPMIHQGNDDGFAVFKELNLVDRETHLTDAEFDALARNDEGRILDDFDLAWVWMTDDQKDRLHSDDWSRGEDVNEELRCMMAEFT